ncbi:MAG: hypothetical protein KAT43_02955 [Nanoarchaeota archaeon]|nr:hypothetical protein [Nanoarchaeota archaeon]
MKRGQVTVFIVIGLILVVVAGIVLYLVYAPKAGAEAEKVEHFSASVMNVRPYVDNCIEQQAMVALIQAAAEAEEKKLPAIEEIETIISDYLNDNVALCANFDAFQEFEVIPGEINSSVKVQKENFIAEVEWPLTIKQKDLTISEEKFRVIFPLRLNELYLKVSDIVSHDVALDVDFLLDKALNIEIIGCVGDNIKYVVNDNDYMVGNSILQFFFNTKMEDIIDIFEFRNGIKYLVPAKPGKVVMRHAGEDKKLIFQLTDDNYIEGCYKKDDKTEFYTFVLVEENKVPVSISTRIPKRIKIDRVSANETGFDFTDMFEFSTEHEFGEGTMFLNTKNSYDPILMFFDGTEWGIIDSRIEGDYLIADITRLGKYAIANRICVEEEKNKFNILFVPVDYTDFAKFALHVEKHANGIFSMPGFNELRKDVSINRISRENDLSCLSWGSLKCTTEAVKKEGSYCGMYDHYIVLINNAEVGLDHRTKDEVTYIGSYLTENVHFCNTCYSAYEFGKFMGLDDITNISNKTHVGVPLMAVPNFDPKEISSPELYLITREKATVLNSASKWGME